MKRHQIQYGRWTKVFFSSTEEALAAFWFFVEQVDPKLYAKSTTGKGTLKEHLPYRLIVNC